LIGYITDISDIKMAIEEGEARCAPSTEEGCSEPSSADSKRIEVKPLKWYPLPLIGNPVSQLYSVLI
jgi:hypothetical protein